MATKVNSLDAWIQARNALAQDLASILELLATEPFSADPASDFQQAKGQRDRIMNQMQKLAVAGIRQIDAEIAAGQQVQQIQDLANDAEDEANKIKGAVKTVGKITKAVDLATNVVTKITQLPFV
jgi:hypothetical protein